MSNTFTLPQIGWKTFFAQQLSEEEQALRPARIFEHHGTEYTLMSPRGTQRLAVASSVAELTVGDWVILDDHDEFVRALERASIFSRKASGIRAKVQHIAANVDTVFVTCSLNDDFSLSRIERYLALTNEAGAKPVVVLTKADRCDSAESYAAQVRQLDSMLSVVTINALDPASVADLTPWCAEGNTIAVVGSSGVGKSTLINTLLGRSQNATAPIRESDGKGRHTTTSRSMHVLEQGGLLVDTPGMRELQLTDCANGIALAFADIAALVERCKFSNCGHESEPGCAVQEAVRADSIDERRLNNYFKLIREQEHSAATLPQRRAHDKKLGQKYRATVAGARKRKKGKR